MQFLWQFDDQSPIFCHLLFRHYGAPINVDHWWETFDRKNYVYGESINLIPSKAKTIKQYAIDHALIYNSSKVLLLWGEDFSHVYAKQSYEIMDKIIN